MNEKLLISLNIIILLLLVFASYRYIIAGREATFDGAGWTARQIGSKYVLSIKNHSELSEALTDFVKNRNIRAGNIVGIGAVDTVTLRFFNPRTKQYEDKTFNGQMEVTNLTGNISEKDGEPLLHLHITLGNDNYNALAGHLLSARISGAGEFVVETYPNTKIEKRKDDETGLNFYNFQ